MLYRGKPILGIQSAKNTVINSKRGNNVQDVVDSLETEKKGKWKLLGSVVGKSTKLNLNGLYDEYLIVVRCGTNNGVALSSLLPRDTILDIDNEQVRMGSYFSSSSYVGCIVNISTTQMWINDLTLTPTTALLEVYGR